MGGRLRRRSAATPAPAAERSRSIQARDRRHGAGRCGEPERRRQPFPLPHPDRRADRCQPARHGHPVLDRPHAANLARAAAARPAADPEGMGPRRAGAGGAGPAHLAGGARRPAARWSRRRSSRQSPRDRPRRPRPLRSPPHLPAPTIEAADAPITRWDAMPPPAGFGPVPPWWRPRQQHAGTYDEAWLAERHPLLPRDFDERFWHCARPASSRRPGSPVPRPSPSTTCIPTTRG